MDLLAIVNRVTILCYPLVCVHCGPVELLSRHPYILLISLEIFFIYLFVSFFHEYADKIIAF